MDGRTSVRLLGNGHGSSGELTVLSTSSSTPTMSLQQSGVPWHPLFRPIRELSAVAHGLSSVTPCDRSFIITRLRWVKYIRQVLEDRGVAQLMLYGSPISVNIAPDEQGRTLRWLCNEAIATGRLSLSCEVMSEWYPVRLCVFVQALEKIVPLIPGGEVDTYGTPDKGKHVFDFLALCILRDYFHLSTETYVEDLTSTYRKLDGQTRRDVLSCLNTNVLRPMLKPFPLYDDEDYVPTWTGSAWDGESEELGLGSEGPRSEGAGSEGLEGEKDSSSTDGQIPSLVVPDGTV